MKRIYLLFIIPYILLACSRPADDNHVSGDTKEFSADIEAIKEKGELVALMENTANSYFIYRGRPMGYEYEVLKMYAEHLGVKLKVKVVHNLDKIITMLNKGKGDIIACNYTITQERKEKISFSKPYLLTHQVLVQRKPKDWRELSPEQLNDSLIKKPSQLVGKTIHAWENSSYFKRLETLEKKYGDMQVVPTSGELESDALIRQVAKRKIDYTVIDDNVAKVHARYYSNLDIQTKVSDQQKIAFGIRKKATNLKQDINNWLSEMSKNSTFNFLKHKYFDINQFSGKTQSNYSSTKSGQISPYDEIIKKASKKVGWDWHLAAALIYQESQFKLNRTSWAGAFGIMQFMPATGAQYGITPQSSASAQINAGLRYLDYHYNNWLEKLNDTSEAVKFSLASYNAGLGHVLDARRLAKKYDANHYVWDDNVEDYILKLSKFKYYTDSEVKYGYMRGIETYNYVNQIISRYKNYKNVYQ